MKRTQFYLAEDLDARLRAAAAAEGRPAAAIVREAVQEYLATRTTTRRADPFEGFIAAFDDDRNSSDDHDFVVYGVRKK